MIAGRTADRTDPRRGAIADVSTSPRISARHVARDHGQKIASRPMMPRKNASVATSSTSVTRPTSGPFSKFGLGRGRQVEADQRDDRSVTTGGNGTVGRWADTAA